MSILFEDEFLRPMISLNIFGLELSRRLLKKMSWVTISPPPFFLLFEGF